jgi:hypothetical protein
MPSLVSVVFYAIVVAIILASIAAFWWGAAS